MTRIGCRAHDYGKLPAAELAAVLHAKGYTGAQLAMPRGIAGIADFAHITGEQLAEIRTAFAAQDVEISVLSCYQDLSAPDADARRAAVDAVKRTLGYAKVLGAKMVGSETAWGPCTDEEKAARLDAVFAVESVDVHPLCTPELLREVLDAAADEAHCRVIFDPVNLFCAKDGQDRAYQAAHWSRWLEVIGDQLGAVHVKDCRIEADGSKTLLPLGEGDMDYTAIRAFLAACAPAAPLIRDEVILTADTADLHYLKAMAAGL